jgi:hypothetical protein
MSSITFEPLVQSPPRPTLKRRSRINRRSASISITSATQISAPAAILQNTATVSERHLTRRERHRYKRSSLHIAVPPIQDRESSLYSPVSVVHTQTQWSKSCINLRGSGSEFLEEEGSGSTTPSTTGTATGTNSTTTSLNQRLSLSTIPILSGGGSDYSALNNDNVRWCKSTLELSTITDDLDTGAAGPINRLDFVYPHSFTDYSHLLDNETFYPSSTHNKRQSILSLSGSKAKEGKWTDLKKKFKGIKVSQEASCIRHTCVCLAICTNQSSLFAPLLDRYTVSSELYHPLLPIIVTLSTYIEQPEHT